MRYIKQTWVNGPAGATPISATRLNYIENGVATAALDAIDASQPEYGLSTDGSDNSPRMAALFAAGDYIVFSQPGTYYFGANVTWSRGKHVRIHRGVKFQAASGVNVLIESDLEAGPWNIFDESLGGTFNLGSEFGPGQIWPEWWGADSAAVTTAEKTAAAPKNVLAFNRALNQTGTTARRRVIKNRYNRTYVVDGQITITAQSGIWEWNGSQIEARNWTDTTQSVIQLGDATNKVFHWNLHDPRVAKLAGAGGGVKALAGIRLFYANFTHLVRPRIGGGANMFAGIYLGDKDCVETFIERAEPNGCDYGVFADGSLAEVAGPNVLSISFDKCQQNALWGVWLKQVTVVELTFGDFSLNGSTDNKADARKNGVLYCENISGLKIGKLYFESNGSDALNNEDRIVWLKNCTDVQCDARISAINTNHDPEYALYLDVGCRAVTVNGMLRGGRKATLYRDSSLDSTVVVSPGVLALDRNNDPAFRGLAANGGGTNTINFLGSHRPRKFLPTTNELVNYIPAPSKLTHTSWVASGTGGSTRNAASTTAPDGGPADSIVFPTNNLADRYKAFSPVIVGSISGQNLVLRFWTKVLSYTPGVQGKDRRCRVGVRRATEVVLLTLTVRPGSDWMYVEHRFSTLQTNSLGVITDIAPPASDIAYYVSIDNTPNDPPVEIAFWGMQLAPEGAEYWADPASIVARYPATPVHGTPAQAPEVLVYGNGAVRLFPSVSDPNTNPLFATAPPGDTTFRVGDRAFTPTESYRCSVAGVPGTWVMTDVAAPSSDSHRSRKTANQNVVDTTLVDITDLSFPVAAGETWEGEFDVVYDSTTGNDAKFTLSVPTGATWRLSGQGLRTAATTNNDQVNALSVTTGVLGYGGTRAAGAAALSVVTRLTAIVVNGATAGTVQLRGAKNVQTDATTPADDLTIYANSVVRAWKY